MNTLKIKQLYLMIFCLFLLSVLELHFISLSGALFAAVLPPHVGENGSTAPKLLSVSRIWDQAAHNAFTDLIEYQGSFFLTFRESNEHAEGEDGSIRILTSEDGKTWRPIAFLSKEGFDLRDPKFSVMPDGRLMLTLGGSIYRQEEYVTTHPLVAFSHNGVDWSDIDLIQMPGNWIWKMAWHIGIGYGVSYHPKDPLNIKTPWIITLLQTKDGLHYSPITDLDVPNHPSEVTLRFLPDGTMIALVRRQGNGWIGSSMPPYTTWKWSDSGSRLGGPDFLILSNGDMWASSRLITKEADKTLTYTALGRMTLSSYQPELVLPSGGDTSYPGMVYRHGILYLSYYSSHEGKTSIYFAQIQLANIP